jgi:acyl carrier protein
MSDQENRLIRCFASVFPGLSAEEIRGTCAQSEGIWDSLSAITLAAVIQEEFNLDIDPEILPELNSFEAFQSYLTRMIPGTVNGNS